LIDSRGTSIVLSTGSKSTGIFESTCTLLCDGAYTVKPVNSYYTFSPVSVKVVAKCCPEYGSATFNATRRTYGLLLMNFFQVEPKQPPSRLYDFKSGYLWFRRFELEGI
jgi:hypothetical protein